MTLIPTHYEWHLTNDKNRRPTTTKIKEIDVNPIEVAVAFAYWDDISEIRPDEKPLSLYEKQLESDNRTTKDFHLGSFLDDRYRGRLQESEERYLYYSMFQKKTNDTVIKTAQEIRDYYSNMFVFLKLNQVSFTNYQHGLNDYLNREDPKRMCQSEIGLLLSTARAYEIDIEIERWLDKAKPFDNDIAIKSMKKGTHDYSECRTHDFDSYSTERLGIEIVGAFKTMGKTTRGITFLAIDENGMPIMIEHIICGITSFLLDNISNGMTKFSIKADTFLNPHRVTNKKIIRLVSSYDLYLA